MGRLYNGGREDRNIIIALKADCIEASHGLDREHIRMALSYAHRAIRATESHVNASAGNIGLDPDLLGVSAGYC